MGENNYDFRRRLLKVHKPRRRNPDLTVSPDELEITSDFSITMPKDASDCMVTAAKDLQDYFFESMGLSLRLFKTDETGLGEKEIAFTTGEHSPEMGKDLLVTRSYRIICKNSLVILCGRDDRGAAQASYHLEEQMNFREAPFIKFQDITRKPLFQPRMIHSGYGLDMFPDEHLNAIAHGGIDSILVFVKDTNITPMGFLDFNELCFRASRYGIDVYVYSYLESLKHPDDPDAREYYEKTYGKIFRECPAFKGIVMVGESVEFPSKDPNTTGRLRLDKPADGLPTGKPSPGWWPCNDYPQWLDMIKGVIRKEKADADIVFWTYNWGYVEEKYRVELLEKIPDDITLLVTFEMFEKVKMGPVTSTCVDYTLFFEGPGEYFASEAKIAKKRGIKLYSMTNTGGLTWDMGVIPYEPCPFQWSLRHEKIHGAREDWGLSGLMESHHFGFWPSFISELAKFSYWSESPSPLEVLKMIAKRDFGEQFVETVIDAWRDYSEGIRNYVSTNEDQYGPFRIGPSYPLVFRTNVLIPTVPHAMFGGNKICNTDYKSRDSGRASLFQFRLPVEIERLNNMRDLFQRGTDKLASIYDKLEEKKKKDAFYMINLGRFIVNCTTTTINVKEWSLLKMKLLLETDESLINEYVNAMIDIGKREIRNAEATIPLTGADSRLGWEPSMEYMTDPFHLKWKIRQVTWVIEKELPAYLDALKWNIKE